MNLRKLTTTEELAERLSILTIGEDDILILRLPDGMQPRETEMLGQYFVDALRGIGKKNSVILLPERIKVQALNEEDMKELGWVKDDRTTNSDSANSRLPKHAESRKVTIDLNETNTVRPSETADKHYWEAINKLTSHLHRDPRD